MPHKTNRRYAFLTAVALSFAPFSVSAATFDFSETINGVNVNGSFTGTIETATPNFINNIANISVSFSKAPSLAGPASGTLAGPLAGYQFVSYATYYTAGTAVVSFNGLANDFIFANGTPLYGAGVSGQPGQATNFLSSLHTGFLPPINALQISATDSVSNATTPTNWKVTEVSPVPIPSTLILFASGLIALGAFRKIRRQA